MVHQLHAEVIRPLDGRWRELWIAGSAATSRRTARAETVGASPHLMRIEAGPSVNSIGPTTPQSADPIRRDGIVCSSFKVRTEGVP